MKSTKVTYLPELPGRIREHTPECTTRLSDDDHIYACNCGAFAPLTLAEVESLIDNKIAAALKGAK